MAITVSYPGVYVQELDSGVRVIPGVPTSITAFVGRARRGPTDTPIRVQGLGEFGRRFGELWSEAPMGYSVTHFFVNGGSDAVIVRVHSLSGADDLARADVPADGGTPMTLTAANPGIWGNQLRATITHPDAGDAFHLTIQEVSPSNPLQVVAEERFLNLTLTAGDARFVTDVLLAQSQLSRVETLPSGRPQLTLGVPIPFEDGDDGLPIDAGQVSDSNLATPRHGIYALENADLFNLLCIPPFAPGISPEIDTWDAAAAYCLTRRAMLLVDPDPAWEPATWVGPDAVIAGVDALITRSPNSAIYFPRIRVPDPLKENRLETFAPSGAVAGVIARIDAQRGVWKAPAGQDATLNGVPELTVRLTDGEQGQLNPIGVNCLRTRPIAGRVVWGARTTRGADQLADQWAYLPVRRTALFIEESLFRGTQWVVFEPNDEGLWSQIRLNVGAFMNGLFRRGAFQGTTPAQAYFVKCDRESNPQEDIDRGIVNIIVGFAPLKPAEFVLLSIQQIRPTV
ncbi:phage tail sheath family protein [Microbacterium sp. DT81.1]|uniref:phage tail sheath family protein n=1 Tax=Microbacterium sp. DT81.1 TaxID=3393413 RepID=UPI003CF865C7